MPGIYESNSDRLTSGAGAGRFLTRRMIMMLAIVLGVMILVFGFIVAKGIIISNFVKAMPKDVTVSTTRPEMLPWQSEVRAVGSLTAFEGADLAPELAGVITKIGFSAGQDVRKGALLFQFNDASERAAADQAMQTYKRDAELIKTNAVSRTEYDAAVANMKSTRAVLEKKAIYAPFSGRVGIRQANVGAYVAAGTVLVTLQQLDPIYVDFKVPQQQLPLLKVGSKVEVSTDTFPGKVFAGTVVALNPRVDDATRTVQVRASIHNPGKELLPGMFASVNIRSGAPRVLLTLPQTAITYSPYGDTVFIVQKSTVNGKTLLTAQQRFVTVGETRGDQVAVLSGISPNEEVVNSGQIKLKNGTPVNINNAVKLSNDANPHPVQQ